MIKASYLMIVIKVTKIMRPETKAKATHTYQNNSISKCMKQVIHESMNKKKFKKFVKAREKWIH
jgi:hypothetical protein